MVREYGDQFVITEAGGAVPLVATIKKLRREISASCSGISSRARRLSLTNRKVELRFKDWEKQLNDIRENTLVTHSIEELEELRHRCEEISSQLAHLSKK